MTRRVAVGNLLQATVYACTAAWLYPRWPVAAGVSAGCAIAQIVAGLTGWTRRPKATRWASVATLAGAMALIGMVAHAALHLVHRFGPDAQNTGWTSLGLLALAVPWLLAFPLWQVLSRGARPVIALIAMVGLPLLAGRWLDGPVQTWPAQPELTVAASASWARWTGSNPNAALPKGGGPATLLLSAWWDGKLQKTIRVDGDDFAAAITSGLTQLPTPQGQRPALVIDVARAQYRLGGLVPAANGGGLGPNGGTSTVVAWRPKRTKNREVIPGSYVPQPRIGRQAPARFDSVSADANGSRPLANGWAQAPEPSAKAVLRAALASGRMLERHQTRAGRFAYTVVGPSGDTRSGRYNYPRHAGTTWFLARLAARTGDPKIAAAADRGLAFMAAHTQQTADGRSYFQDPRRRDGKAWVGTTSLAALAATVRFHPLAKPWGRFLASSVDDQGQVRGEMQTASGEFQAQKLNPYGQGQTVLALAALVRAGHSDLRPALERAAAFFDGGYGPAGANRLVTLDEHWACLAALATKEAIGVDAGWEVCRAYLADTSLNAPAPGQHLYPYSGGAGGLAEAVVAAAVLDPTGPFHDRAVSYAEGFLRNAYRAGDRPMLGKARALMGGFRDTPFKLDVRMDAIQHIGCALLGIEALMTEPRVGSYP